MTVPFATSARSSVGLEWELMLADGESGDLVPRAPEVIDALEERTALERYTVTGELLTNTVEVTSGIGDTVAAAVDDIADAIAAIRTVTNPMQVELLCAGSHPFAQWYDQQVTDKTRYHKLIERTQWWGRNMMIWGIHVHVGVEDVNKVFPIINALAVYLPHLQALSASSPFWAGERTGYASNRSLVFQQLPTAGLPWPLQNWAEFESLPRRHDPHRRHGRRDRGAVGHPPGPALGHDRGARVRRHVDPARSSPRSPSLVQVLVEHFSPRARRGPRAAVDPAVVRAREQVARRALRAGCAHHRRPRGNAACRCASTSARRWTQLGDIAVELKCAREFAGLETIMTQGASYARQTMVADAADGDLREVVQHLIREFRAGPTLREHLAALGH